MTLTSTTLAGQETRRRLSRAASGKLLLVLAVAALVAAVPGAWPLAYTAMGDAFLQVTTYVAATLALVYAIERYWALDLGRVMARAGYFQSFYAALLGALPGCGGAIIVVTQFTRGTISFGSIVSVLIATMGDAAFLLIAREPQTALIVISVSAVVGTISGWIVDAIHGPDFLKPARREGGDAQAVPARAAPHKLLDYLWLGLVALTMPITLALSFQADANQWFGPLGAYDPVAFIGAAGALLTLLLWTVTPSTANQAIHNARQPLGRRVVDETSFVTAWVVLAFLSYELAVHVTGVDVGDLFAGVTLLMPVIGMLVGLIPGCGPQIVVTTLYLAGAIPLSAQFANAIANDGDALFPAIALAPRAAVLATLYSAVPAVLVGYGWMFLFEMR